jgi:hypothetical protein
MRKDYRTSDAQKILFFDDSWEHLQRILEIIQNKNPKEILLGTNVFEYVANHLEAWIELDDCPFCYGKGHFTGGEYEGIRCHWCDGTGIKSK